MLACHAGDDRQESEVLRLTRLFLHVTRVTSTFTRRTSMKCQSFPFAMIFATVSLSTVLLFWPASIGSAAESGLDTAKIESITGLKGVLNEKENSFKVSKPRSDVAINVDQARLAPFMGFTSWAAFTPGSKDSVMVMGDMVLFQDEVNPVMSVALDKGLDVTALHNHFFYDDPHAYSLPIGGTGQINGLAGGFRAILDKVKEIRAANPKLAEGFGGPALPATSSITGKAIEDILGTKGQAKDGMFNVVIGRTTKMPCGCIAGKDMGVNTWAAFSASDGNAVVDGDFAIKETELQDVLKSLRKSGINIVAIHSHMTEETPRILSLHYWAKGKAADLADALKQALSLQKEK